MPKQKKHPEHSNLELKAKAFVTVLLLAIALYLIERGPAENSQMVSVSIITAVTGYWLRRSG